MTTRLVILSGLLLCGSLASGKNELSFKETVVPVKVAPDQDSITASFPFTNTSGTPVTISKIHVSCDCTTAGAKDNKLTYAPGESGVISAVMKTGNFSGTVDKDMTVHANGSAYKLVIRAQIPDIIRMETPQAGMGQRRGRRAQNHKNHHLQRIARQPDHGGFDGRRL